MVIFVPLTLGTLGLPATLSLARRAGTWNFRHL